MIANHWHKLSLRTGITLTALSCFIACGGKSDEDGNGGAGGVAGAAGAGGFEPGRGGQTGSGGAPSMGGRGGTAQGGQAGGCEVGGTTYPIGSTFPAGDGCNSCTCTASGAACTTIACDDCRTISTNYADAAERARKCDPTLRSAQCTLPFPVGLVCQCTSFVNAANTSALDEMRELSAKHSSLMCNSGVVCGACLEPQRGYCSPAGLCEDFRAGEGRSCKVNGMLYPDGATNIPDPVSCNRCSCEDGSLVCTEIYCPKPCPSGTAFGQQCAQCGPADGCELVEFACFPACSGETCQNGFCSNGACVISICG